MQLDKKLIGHTFKPFTAVAEAGKLKLFCKAIGEEDPIYQSEEAAKKAGYPKIPVSPTFLQALTNDDPEKGGALWFVVSETAMKYKAGKLVAKATSITVVRNPDAGKK